MDTDEYDAACRRALLSSEEDSEDDDFDYDDDDYDEEEEEEYELNREVQFNLKTTSSAEPPPADLKDVQYAVEEESGNWDAFQQLNVSSDISGTNSNSSSPTVKSSRCRSPWWNHCMEVHVLEHGMHANVQ